MYILLLTKRICVVQGTLEFMNEQGTWTERGGTYFFCKPCVVLKLYKGFEGKKIEEKRGKKNKMKLLPENINTCICIPPPIRGGGRYYILHVSRILERSLPSVESQGILGMTGCLLKILLCDSFVTQSVK